MLYSLHRVDHVSSLMVNGFSNPKIGGDIYDSLFHNGLLMPHLTLQRTSHVLLFGIKSSWSSAGRSFVMRSLNPCPENFDQVVVVWGRGVNYQMENIQTYQPQMTNSGGGEGKLPNTNCDQTTKWKISKNYQLEMFDPGGWGKLPNANCYQTIR